MAATELCMWRTENKFKRVYYDFWENYFSELMRVENRFLKHIGGMGILHDFVGKQLAIQFLL